MASGVTCLLSVGFFRFEKALFGKKENNMGFTWENRVVSMVSGYSI